MQYLNYKDYKNLIAHSPNYWEDIDGRWEYHERAINILKKSNTHDPEKILEVGTMGITLVSGSHTLDYDLAFNIENQKPTYLHDIRNVPWPIKDKQYDWFVALRVFHHLWPMQRRCFEEAKRISKNLIIVVPQKVSFPSFNKPKTLARRVVIPTVKGITYKQFTNWNHGTPPTYYEELKSRGTLFYWKEDDLSLASRNHYFKVFEELAGGGG